MENDIYVYIYIYMLVFHYCFLVVFSGVHHLAEYARRDLTVLTGVLSVVSLLPSPPPPLKSNSLGHTIFISKSKHTYYQSCPTTVE